MQIADVELQILCLNLWTTAPGVHTQQDHSETADVAKQDSFSPREAPTQTKINTLGKRRASTTST